MASRPIDEKIVKLSIDNQSFKEKLTESVTSLKGLSDSMSGVKTDGLESATKSTQSLGSRLAELVSKINEILKGITPEQRKQIMENAVKNQPLQK